MLHGYIDIPTLHYFDENNIWTGSVFQNFNYRIIPVSSDEKKELVCKIWYGSLCYDLTDNFAGEYHEELTEDGLNNLISIINSEIEKFKINNN